MTTINPETQEAVAAASEAWIEYQRAKEEAISKSVPAVYSLILDDVADLHKEGTTVASVRFSSEYVYDDEGGYFESISVALVDDKDEDIDYCESAESYGVEPIRLLFGVDDRQDAASMTIAEMKKRHAN